MTTMISDQAKDYETAAISQLGRETKASHDTAHAAVEAEVADRVQRFARKSRSDIDSFIDACPQTGP